MLAPENCPQVPAGTRNGLLLWLARESPGEKVWCQKSLLETCRNVLLSEKGLASELASRVPERYLGAQPNWWG
jgi:hypothetical protein